MHLETVEMENKDRIYSPLDRRSRVEQNDGNDYSKIVVGEKKLIPDGIEKLGSSVQLKIKKKYEIDYREIVFKEPLGEGVSLL